jgi:hypothetical protein
MTAEQVIEQITTTAKFINAPTPLLLAIANVETGGTFKNGSSTSAKYSGVFQLASGYGGCSASSRNDVAEATKCTWKQIVTKKSNFVKEFGTWNDWFAYGLHQQGLAGFKEIYRNRNNKLSSLSSARQNAIKGNLPDSISKNIVYISEYMNYWKDRIDGLMQRYGEASEAPVIVINTADVQWNGFENITNNIVQNSILLPLSLVFFGALLLYKLKK